MANCTGCSFIWKTAVPKGVDSRQFYIDGVRANRTWIPFPANSSKPATSAVITVPGVDMLAWKHNVSAIELVYRGANPNSAGSPWQESRCPTATISISTNGMGAATAVTIAQPCAWNGNNKIHGRQALRIPAFVENVFELLGDVSAWHKCSN